jgi:hypothetical protein
MREKHTIFPGNVAEHNAHALAPKAGDFAATLDRVQARTRATPCRVDEEEQVARASSPPAAGLLRRALSGDGGHVVEESPPVATTARRERLCQRFVRPVHCRPSRSKL